MGVILEMWSPGVGIVNYDVEAIEEYCLENNLAVETFLDGLRFLAQDSAPVLAIRKLEKRAQVSEEQLDEVVGNVANVMDLAQSVYKASERAKETNRLVYVRFDQLFFYMTYEYPGRKNLVAKCYPGGRIELHKQIFDA